MEITEVRISLRDDAKLKAFASLTFDDCFVIRGLKLIGLLTITDTRGNEVQNPLHEFDSCFNPQSSDAPTGVTVPRPPVVNPGTPVA